MAQQPKHTLTEEVEEQARQARRDRDRHLAERRRQGLPPETDGTGSSAPGGRANVRDRDKTGPADGLGGHIGS